ncbi:hypothetical protein D9619_001311 [Psilocybe cf. subviscida]|uniref:Uncharacterized protein n=1 Tax=Psilocybe cf. subviscida TaxID=2480587 RepID=A0A8H5F2V9_9AGAR|nr:hypothetical protein D9619_001311 [Psilocybe cf. subviscida]
MDLRQRDGAIPIVHENLTQLNLRIGVCSTHDILTFFSNCIFPNLKKLRISVHKMKAMQPDDQVFTINAFASLEFLKIEDDIRIPTDLLLSLLRGAPKLKGLSLHLSDIDGCNTDLGKVLEAMTIADGHCEMLPLLKGCSFFGLADAPETKFLLDATVVGRFIHSRFADLPEGCSSLDTIAIGGCFRFLADVEEEVALLSDDANPIDILIDEDNEPLPSFSCDNLQFETPFSSTYSNIVAHTKAN